MNRLTKSGSIVSQRDINQLLESSNENQFGMNDAYYKLKHYEDLEEQGLILKLPCKLGTTLYYVVPDMSVTWPDDPEYKITTIAFRPDMINEFGKTAFLTREEADIARREANKAARR